MEIINTYLIRSLWGLKERIPGKNLHRAWHIFSSVVAVGPSIPDDMHMHAHIHTYGSGLYLGVSG